MELKDIIKHESDRIFIVDPGCFIIFTGNSIEDSQPFIRIGNWHDMPVDIIPLIENIIVTDSLTGNPALEQFNININSQSSNRYIGSHYTLRKFLDFQKIFGLDLKNVTVVDVENDIPEINSRTISDREAFIGIFYRDGNFKITHRGRDLFNLHENLKKNYNTNRIIDLVFENTRGQKLYQQPGFIFGDQSRVFFDEENIYISEFPSDYLAFFNESRINPRRIRGIAHDSANYINLAEFLGWANSCSLKCSLFSDDKQGLSVIKKLFSSAQLDTQPLSGAEFTLSSRMSVKEINGSRNRIVTLHGSSECNLLFVSSVENLLKHIKKDISAVFVPCSLYEDCSLILKSSGIPGAVIDDGDKAFSKITSLSEIPVYRNVRYTLRCFTSTDECLNHFSSITGSDDLIHLLASDLKDSREKIEEYLNAEQPIFNKINFLSMIQYFINITSDRRLSSQLSKIHQHYGLQYCVKNLAAMNIPFCCELIVADNGMFQTFFHDTQKKVQPNFIPVHGASMPESDSTFTNHTQAVAAAGRIVTDRERLMQLIRLFTETNGKSGAVAKLRTSISVRKELYSNAHVTQEEVDSINERSLMSESSTARQDSSVSKSLAGKAASVFLDLRKYNRLNKKRNELERLHSQKGELSGARPTIADYFLLSKPLIFIRSLKLPYAIALLLLLCLLILSGPISTVYRNTVQNNSRADAIGEVIKAEDEAEKTSEISETEESEKPADKEVLEERVSGTLNSDIVERYNITVSNTDIFHYVNRIAELNGYSPIPQAHVNGKNPHWIYPGNIFMLPDNERFIVREGDSLWTIAELKLRKISIEFYKLSDEIRRQAAEGNERPVGLFEKAAALSFNSSHEAELKTLNSLF